MATPNICPICYGMYSNVNWVSTIPCGHSFCKRCVTRMRDGGRITCGICRRFFRDEIRKNYQFMDLLEENNMLGEAEEEDVAQSQQLEVPAAPTQQNGDFIFIVWELMNYGRKRIKT